MPERKMIISTKNLRIEAILAEGSSADTFWNSLPITGRANTWGDEIYFSTDISLDNDEDASDVVDSGSLAYWPPDNAIFIFFGRTPASIESEPRAASPVNIFGRVDGDEHIFRSVKPGSPMRLEVE